MSQHKIPKMLQLLVEVIGLSIFLFAIIHILIGLALIYYYGKLQSTDGICICVLNYEFYLLGNGINKFVVKIRVALLLRKERIVC